MRFSGFLRQAFGVGAITVADRAAGFVLAVVLARWLGPEGYGIFAFVMAAAALAAVPVRFGLPEWLMRELAAGRAGAPLAARTLALVLATGLGGAVAGSAVVALAAEPGSLRSALLIGLWMIPLTAALEVLGHALRGWGRPALAQAILTLVPTLLVLAGIGALIWAAATGTAAAALGIRAAMLAAAALAGLALALRLAPRPGAGAPPPAARAMLRAAFPFMLIGAAGVVMARTDVLMLGLLAGTLEAGLYNVAAQAAALVLLVLNVGATVAAPQFARLEAAGDRVALARFAASSARAVALAAAPVGLLLIVFGGPLLALVFGADFGAGAMALAILAAGALISLVWGTPGFLLNMTGFEALSLRIMAGAAALNVALNAALIPAMGPEGAALATALALNAQKAAGWLAVRRRLGMDCGCLGLGTA